MTPQPIPVSVLVVDDDPMSRELLSVLLEAEGYSVESAESGAAALTRLSQRASAPDLVLTDVQMPGTTGSQLARELRRACGPATLLLAMSGSRPAAQAISHFDGFLMKPFKMPEIAAALAARTHAADAPKAPKTIAPVRKGNRAVVSGTARTSPSRSKAVSISAPAPALKTASRKKDDRGMKAQKTRPSESVGADSSVGNPILNEKIYQQLADSMPTQQLHEMYSMCLNDARERIAGMRGLAAAHDRAQFVRQAHAIKGGCGMLGATELHSMAAELESSDLEVAATAEAKDVYSLDELSAACDRLERMLRSRI
jgi:CheY-like chemotaxis protein/HPt (histidine-containing phosphotransfer) domain-containing protein